MNAVNRCIKPLDFSLYKAIRRGVLLVGLKSGNWFHLKPKLDGA